MRLFLAVELDDSVRTAAAHIADSVQDAIERHQPPLAVRWIPADNLHLTLWFLGEVGDDRIERLTSALRVPMPVSPFEAHLADVGAFPSLRAPRVIWLGVDRGREHFGALYDEIGRRVVPLGFAREARPYSAHLTVGRVKEGRGPVPVPARTDAGSWRVDHVTLFRSRLSPRGATYEALLRVPLA